MKNRARSSSHVRRRWKGLAAVVALFALTALCPPALTGQAAPAATGPEPGHAWVIFGTDTVAAEIAGSGSERSRGLQNRTELAPGSGMLFTFASHEKRTFWMKDTLVDLDLAVLDENRRIVEILAMQAESLELHDTEHVVFMALEVPAGWFAENGIGVGDEAFIVMGPDSAP